MRIRKTRVSKDTVNARTSRIISIKKNVKKNLPNRTVNRSVNKAPIQPVQSHPKTENIIHSLQKTNMDDVFIIGGGPSLEGFDFSTLRGKDVITVNKAIEYVDFSKYFITMDYTFLKKTTLTIDEINNKCNSSYFIVNKAHPYMKYIDGIYTDTRINFKYFSLYKFTGVIESNKVINDQGFGKSINDFSNGSNSGYCAIQLAILLGYKNIYLLGFDMNSENVTHFHKGYNQDVNSFNHKLSGYKKNLIDSINYLNEDVNDNTKFYSCSKNSLLNDTIEYKDIRALLSSPNLNTVNKMNNLNDLMIVAYYTVGTPYETEAKKLKASLDKIKLNYDIVGVKNLGNWQANTRFKAQFMLDMLDKHPDCRLLYVDCDAIVHRRPELFSNYSCDIAVRWQDFRWRKNECLSGTIYMENNDKTRELCKMWLNINDSEGKNAKTFEQWNLGSAIEKMKRTHGLVAKNLPPEYTFIFDSMRKMYPNARPVIEHFQASRRLRNKV